MNNNMKLQKVDTRIFEFAGVRDMDLTHVFECGQCFRWVPALDGSGDYIGAVGGYAARAHYDKSSYGDEQCNAEAGTLTLEVTGGSEDFWYNYFDLGTDYSEIKSVLAASDPSMEDAISYGQGIRILRQELFETIVSFIISQNNNIPRIRKNIEALCERYGEPIGVAFGREWYAFPSPRALAEAEIEGLAELKLGYRSAYIRAAGERFISCGEPSSSGEVLSFLGVGPKVANCIMLFGLRQVDAFPIDTWVKQIMNDRYGLAISDVKGMADFAKERFGRYAGYAQQYLFYYYRDRRASLAGK